MAERYDVVIVGGGPAGSTCAGNLRQSGMTVLILDKATFPRDKTCAGWITPQVIETLNLDIDDYASRHVFQPIEAFRVGTISGAGVHVDFQKPVSYGIRRYEFDNYLLHRCGVPTRQGTPVRSLTRTDQGWRINDDIECSVLIGAGGHFCPVARHLRQEKGASSPLVTAVEAEFPLSDGESASESDGRTPRLYFCDDLSGYGWCVRKGNYLNMGIGLTDSRQTSARMPELLRTINEEGAFTGIVPVRFHGHAYHLHAGPPALLADEGVLLIGDAAGLADAQSGEGIRPAVESAILAARSILTTPGALERATFEDYVAHIRHRFGPPQSVRGPMQWIPLAWRRRIARRLLRSPWFVKRMVLERWFLHAHQPALKAASDAQLVTH